MCGIAGYFGHRKLSDKIISNTFDLMHSRGPDSKNFYKLRIKDKSLYLLHTRLKIIDLSNKANQPFFYKGNILVYNGEIYNYLDLKKKLEVEYQNVRVIIPPENLGFSKGMNLGI